MLKSFVNSDPPPKKVLLVKHKENYYFSLLLFFQPLKIDLHKLKSNKYVEKIMILVILFIVAVDCSLHFNFIYW